MKFTKNSKPSSPESAQNMSICNVCESCVYCDETPLGNTFCKFFDAICFRYTPCFFYVPLDGEEDDK